jgi:hypothetical protein
MTDKQPAPDYSAHCFLLIATASMGSLQETRPLGISVVIKVLMHG